MTDSRPILVTGGFGFIGSAMVRRLLDQGEKVTILAKEETRTDRLTDVLDSISVIWNDLQDPILLKEAMETLSPRGVFHFAASNIQSGVISGNQDVVDTNILGTVNLIDALSGMDYDFFINIGSFLEYGMKGRPLVEIDLPEPMNLYSISKLAGTLYGQLVAQKDKKPIVTLRIMTPYGPGIQEGRLVRALLQSAMKDEPVSLSAPSISRDFLYVEDLIDLCLEVAGKADQYGGELFNAGTGIATTLEALSKEVLALTNSKSEVKWGTFKNVSYDSDMWCADMTKTFGAFSWRPQTSLTEGVRKTYEWLKSQKV